MPVHTTRHVHLYYEVKGEGKALVFLHGFTGSTRDWDKPNRIVCKRIIRLLLSIIEVTVRQAPPSLEEDYSINFFSEDVFGLLEELKVPSCCLVGHSMGGFMALQFTLDHPEMVEALVLVDTSSGEWEVAPGYAELRAKTR